MSESKDWDEAHTNTGPEEPVLLHDMNRSYSDELATAAMGELANAVPDDPADE